MAEPRNDVISSAVPRRAEAGDDDAPEKKSGAGRTAEVTPLRRDPMLSYDPQPVATRSTVSPSEPPSEPTPGRSSSILMATLLDATTQTLAMLGLTRPTRLPLGALAFGALFFFLGLPPDWMDAPLSGRLIELGDWNAAVALKAGLVLVLSVFVLQLAVARPRIDAASREVPERIRQRLLAGVDALLAETVIDDAQLSDWLHRQDAWFQTAVRELAEGVSQAAADAFRRAPVEAPVRFRHRYNDVHDGALNLLARRARFLQNLSVRRER